MAVTIQWLWFCYRISNYSIDSYLLVACILAVALPQSLCSRARSSSARPDVSDFFLCVCEQEREKSSLGLFVIKPLVNFVSVSIFTHRIGKRKSIHILKLETVISPFGCLPLYNISRSVKYQKYAYSHSVGRHSHSATNELERAIRTTHFSSLQEYHLNSTLFYSCFECLLCVFFLFLLFYR